MRPRGWRSEETLAKAKRELLQTQLIVETRKGWRPNRASLYALMFFALDYCDGKLAIIAPAGFPYGAWKLMDRLPPPKKRTGKTLATHRKTRCLLRLP